ncbi:MAG TPA: DUF1573 domain-containing protein, partial [Rhodothermales bacterium]|nr:DUF1573 domain-containing protein [Rhodothermales bacterium]
MLRRHVSLTLLACGFLLVPVWPAAAQSKIVFAEQAHAFGTIDEGDQAAYTFTFENEGNAPLHLITVRPSCGCTTPTWPREAIAPGQTGDVLVSFNSSGRPGPFEKTVAVNTDGDPAQVVLTIRGTVRHKPLENAVAQGNLLIESYGKDLGRIPPGQRARVTFQIQNSGERPIRIEGVRLPDRGVNIQYPNRPLFNSDVGRITLTVD